MTRLCDLWEGVAKANPPAVVQTFIAGTVFLDYSNAARPLHLPLVFAATLPDGRFHSLSWGILL